MKKLTTFVLCSLLILSVFAGCTQKDATSTPDEVTTALQTEPTTVPPVTESPDVTNYPSEYLRIINEYEESYGTGNENGILYLGSGLYYARLIDFDNSGVPEMILVYYCDDVSAVPYYSIYTMINGKAECVLSDYTYTDGGADPVVKLAFTEDKTYFVTGSSQWWVENNYHEFTGEEFITAFHSHSNGDSNYKINGVSVSQAEYESEVAMFRETFTNEEQYRLGQDPAATRAYLNDTKAELSNQ